MPAVPVESVDQLDLFPVHCSEAGVQVHDAAEDGDGHPRNDDRGRRGAQPDDEQRGEGGFRQAVEHDQVRLQDLREPAAAPQEDCGKDARKCDKEETDDGLVERHPYVEENGAVHHHFPEAGAYPCGTAEDE